jgi:acetate---CoA ligase (ADP-forming)
MIMTITNGAFAPWYSALFAPRSVAVIGASADARKPGGRPVSYLRKHGFAGRILPVNPKLDQIDGLTCYPDIASLPEAPDAAIVLLGAARAAQAVTELAARGTKVAIVLASGYSESGPHGQALQDELAKAAGDMRLLGPNTIGAMDLHSKIMLSASGALEADDLPTGVISVASQSGGILGAVLSRGAARGIGFAKLASTGNEVDLDIADLIEGMALDPQTQVIAAYIEGIRSVEKFRHAAQQVRAQGKALVIYKVGRSESGARAAVSHTGAMAGEDRLYDALFKQVGAVRVQGFDDLLDLSAMLATGRKMAGNRVAVLTSTGGAGSLIADNCGVQGLDVPVLDEQTAAHLADILAADVPQSANPVDVTLAGVKSDIMIAATGALLDSNSVDAVVVVVGSSALAQPEVAVGAITAGAARSSKPVLAYVSPHAPHILRDLNLKGIPAFAAPETCALVLRAALERTVPPQADLALIRALPSFPQTLPVGLLSEAQASALFAQAGVPVAPFLIVHDAKGAEEAAVQIGGEVVLKLLSEEVSHKSDIGGVKLGLNATTIGPALIEMGEKVAAYGVTNPDSYLVQKMMRGGTEVILGLRRDPQLGTFLLLGAGGVLAELTGDTTVRLLPVTSEDARAMVGELRLSRLLAGYRGSKPKDVDALVDAIVAFAQMGEALGPRLIEVEINPLMVFPDGNGVAATDGLAILQG